MKTKANIGLALVISFVLTIIIGFLLHLKSHGILIQPRSIFKITHWIVGYAMAALFFIHWTQFRKMLAAMKKSSDGSMPTHGYLLYCL